MPVRVAETFRVEFSLKLDVRVLWILTFSNDASVLATNFILKDSEIFLDTARVFLFKVDARSRPRVSLRLRHSHHHTHVVGGRKLLPPILIQQLLVRDLLQVDLRQWEYFILVPHLCLSGSRREKHPAVNWLLILLLLEYLLLIVSVVSCCCGVTTDGDWRETRLIVLWLLSCLLANVGESWNLVLIVH